MDDRRFDAVTRAVARLGSRRALLRVLGGGAGAVVLSGLSQRGASSARCKNLGRKCDKNRDCCDGRCKRGRCRCTRDKHCKSSEYCKRGRCKVVPCGAGGPCRVFVTSTWMNGDLGGLEGADTTCQSLASDAGLTGTYQAWLSDDTVSPDSRFFKSPDPYVRLDDKTVASNWDDLTDGSIQNPIIVTEQGETSWPSVWTNTTFDGLPIGNSHCEGWTTGVNNGKSGKIGYSPYSDVPGYDGWWTDAERLNNCDLELALYCFEQAVE